MAFNRAGRLRVMRVMPGCGMSSSTSAMSHPCALAGRATNYGPGVRLASSVAVDLGRTIGVHSRGRGDPTTIVTPNEAWLARRTPDGPATLRVTPTEAEAWGPGRDWMLAGVDDLL